MDFDISQTLKFLGNTFTNFLNCSLSASKAINDHSATITIAISLSAVVTWFLYRKHTKRRLKVDVNLSLNASDSFREVHEMHKLGRDNYRGFAIWDVSLKNPGYHTVYIRKVGLLYRDWWLGKEKKIPISHEYPMGIAIKPGDERTVQARYRPGNIELCPRKVSGAYAKDKTGKVWRVCKRLKVAEHCGED